MRSLLNRTTSTDVAIVQRADTLQSRIDSVWNAYARTQIGVDGKSYYRLFSHLFLSLIECLAHDHQLPVLFTRDNVLHVGLVAEVRVLVLGLDGAGKTALINQAKHLFMTPDSANASLTRVGRPQGVVCSQFTAYESSKITFRHQKQHWQQRQQLVSQSNDLNTTAFDGICGIVADTSRFGRCGNVSMRTQKVWM